MRRLETTKKELMALEKKYWDAVKDRDPATATSLSGDTCVVVGAQGVGEIDKPTLAKMLVGAPYELKDFELSDVHMHPVSDDVAAIAYKVTEDIVVDGKELTLEAYDSSVWAKRDGRWVCVVHTESLAGDPYGRH